ncbi:MAG: hypothetical protein J6S67_04665 [Methanobrevibacter sp.]|nr:hypothetical protein [Methanobrevibacter sp.]
MSRVSEYMQELLQLHRVSYCKLIRMLDYLLYSRYSYDERKDIGMFYGIEAIRRTLR